MMFCMFPFSALADQPAAISGDVTSLEAVHIAKEEMLSELPVSEGSLKREGVAMVLKDDTPKDGDNIILPIQGNGKIEMNSNENGTIKIDLPDDGGANNAAIVNNSTIIYANTGVDVDSVVTVPNDTTIETYHIIRSSQSPKKYEYKITLPVGGKFEQIDDTTIAILNSNDLPEMIVSAPTAKDAKDQAVSIKLTIETNRIILFVEHDEKFTYPIIADPTYMGVTMNDAEWNFCRWTWNWGLCVGVNSLASKALKEAENVSSKYGWEIHNGGADAFRHCYWSGIMTSVYDSKTAKGFGDRHEDTPKPKDKKNAIQWQNEKDMDLFNNQKGRDWMTSKVSIKDKCIEGVKKGNLRILTKKP